MHPYDERFWPPPTKWKRKGFLRVLSSRVADGHTIYIPSGKGLELELSVVHRVSPTRTYLASQSSLASAPPSTTTEGEGGLLIMGGTWTYTSALAAALPTAFFAVQT